jgi:hypothetical protein
MKYQQELDLYRQKVECSARAPREEGIGLVFNEDKVSVGKDENIVEVGYGNCCTALECI